MKIKNLIILVLLISIACSAFKLTDTTLQKLHASEGDIKKAIVSTAINDTDAKFYNVGLTNFAIIKQVINGNLSLNKKEAINSIMEYIKTYYNSAEFKEDVKAETSKIKNMASTDDSVTLMKHYESSLKTLEDSYIMSKNYDPKSQKEKILNGSRPTSDKNIDQAMEIMKNNPQLAAQSGMTAEQIQQILAQTKVIGQAGSKIAKETIDKEFDNSSVQINHADIEQQYEKEKKKIKQNYDVEMGYLRIYLQKSRPNTKANIKAALSKLIAMIDNVDFSAKVDNKQFVKKEYEEKDSYWKMTYRAGKENAMLVRTAAAQWLSELK